MRRLGVRAVQFFKDRAGATAVEFALVMPLVIASIFGTFEAGLAFYEKNRVGAACSAGARQILISGADDNSAIEAAIRGKYKSQEQDSLNVTLGTKTVSGEDFKEIVVTFTHELIVGIGKRYDDITLSTTCYGRGV